ncbi:MULTISPECIES: acyl-CoA thioesterase [Nocardiaceae]|uniref:Thioesterase family protein n=1 Tax=Rhodococcus cercidiphylli TaxID=489916 RepID=A0ABU4AWH5_9NOCA|nr:MULTISPECIES: acyl-CoA thioesterase domain-containing protein [Rhodococcus]KJU99991.1 putative acyl-CoA thioesterase [Rhodococcus sp. PML026]MDV6230586.1 thioesterase family protein [Rhodococcus cercidiphylli]
MTSRNETAVTQIDNPNGSRTPNEAGTTSPVSLAQILHVDRMHGTTFRSTFVEDTGYSLFGGQVAGQALIACGSTVETDRHADSLHCYFIRGGRTDMPIDFAVEIDRDGRTFSARRVVASQDGRALFTMSALFAAHGEDDPTAERSVPDTDVSQYDRFETPPPGFDVHLPQSLQPGALPTDFWAVPHAALPSENSLIHAAALTYMSDFSTPLTPPRGSDRPVGPSLDHAVWFHRVPRWVGPVRVTMNSGPVHGRRGWYTGTVADRSGTITASFAQEMIVAGD